MGPPAAATQESRAASPERKQAEGELALRRPNGQAAVGSSGSVGCHTSPHLRKLAELLHQRGKYKDALEKVEKHLIDEPHDLVAIVLKGKCMESEGNAAGAFTCYASALTQDPHSVEAHMACASLYKSRGMLGEALESLTSARASDPDNQSVRQAMAVILTDLGTEKKHAGDMEEGMELYKEAQEAEPEYAPAYYNMGVALCQLGQPERAMAQYQKAVKLNPGYAEAYCNMGVILKNKGELEEAVVCYQKATQLAPRFEMVAHNLAVALTDLATKIKGEGKVDEAIKLYEKALSYSPQYPEAMYNCGVIYAETGQIDKAIFMYEMSTQLSKHCPEAFNNVGVLYKDRGNLEKAIQCYMAALQLRPNFPQSLNNLGVLYTAQGLAKDGHTMLQAAIQACPGYAEAYNNIGVLYRDVGDIPQAITAYEKCLELEPSARNAAQNRLLALNYIYPGEEPSVCRAHEEWGEHFAAPLRHMLPPLDAAEIQARNTSPGHKLTVGYISPDLYTHSVSYFAHAPLSHHDSTKIRFIVYSCVPKADSKTERMQQQVETAGGTWKAVTGLTELQLAQMIRDDHVDVLVELTGHTANNRLGVMAMRAAPVQITWIGYPNSTGLQEVDYRITDSMCDPLSTKQTFSEELVRLPGCFLCYTPSHDAPPVAPLPAARDGFVSFGSFNNLAKITPEVISCWACILKEVPSSRLLLKNKPFACEDAKAHFLKKLEMEGVEPSRVDLLPLIASNQGHLAAYSLIDISLDPFPYAGTTTTTESLYMGVPCITLAGHCHAHNVGVSLLKTVGLDDKWIAYSKEEYVEQAVRAASDIPALQEIRATLRERMVESPMCDAEPFVRHLETVYGDLWARWEEQSYSVPQLAANIARPPETGSAHEQAETRRQSMEQQVQAGKSQAAEKDGHSEDNEVPEASENTSEGSAPSQDISTISTDDGSESAVSEYLSSAPDCNK